MYDNEDTLPQELADGGLVGKFANALSERIFGRPPAPPASAASAAAAPAQPASAPTRPPGGALGGVMQRREAAAGLADGGPVLPEDEQPIVPENGVIQGPGGPVDDAIATELPTGAYVVPADVTPVLVSDKESVLSPELLQGAMAAAMDFIKNALHTPAAQQPQSPAAPAFADGGPVQPRNALQQRRASMQAQKLADGGLVDDEQRRQQSIAQIPTGGMTAPAADGSQSNPFTNNEVGRNLGNAAAAMSGVSGPLASAAQALAPTARTMLQAPATTRAASTVTDQATNAGSALRRWAPAAGLGAGALAGGAAGSDTAPAAPSNPLARPAAGAGIPPFNDARFEVARGNYADSRTPGQPAAPAPAPAADTLREPGKIYRQGNSYSGTGNIQDGAEIVGARAALSRPGGISPQNEAAAQALSDRGARESLGRVMASMQPQQQAAPATPFVASGGSFGFRRDPNIVMAEQAGIVGFNRARGTDPRSLANAAAERLAAQKDQGEFARAMLQERGAMGRTEMQEQGADARARLLAGANVQRAQIAADAKGQQGNEKPLPAPAVKMQDGHLEAIGLASSITKDLGVLANQLGTGALKLGPMENLQSRARNAVGSSSQNSRNFQSFQSTLEKLRNDSLRLNSGVQTEGDAQRAWNELGANINDPEVVKQRLAEIQTINDRAAGLRMRQNDAMRANYGAAPMDYSEYTGVKPAVGSSQPRTVTQRGTHNGRAVIKYSDGTVDYADQ